MFTSLNQDKISHQALFAEYYTRHQSFVVNRSTGPSLSHLPDTGPAASPSPWCAQPLANPARQDSEGRVDSDGGLNCLTGPAPVAVLHAPQMQTTTQLWTRDIRASDCILAAHRRAMAALDRAAAARLGSACLPKINRFKLARPVLLSRVAGRSRASRPPRPGRGRASPGPGLALVFSRPWNPSLADPSALQVGSLQRIGRPSGSGFAVGSGPRPSFTPASNPGKRRPFRAAPAHSPGPARACRTSARSGPGRARAHRKGQPRAQCGGPAGSSAAPAARLGAAPSSCGVNHDPTPWPSAGPSARLALCARHGRARPGRVHQLPPPFPSPPGRSPAPATAGRGRWQRLSGVRGAALRAAPSAARRPAGLWAVRGAAVLAGRSEARQAARRLGAGGAGRSLRSLPIPLGRARRAAAGTSRWRRRADRAARRAEAAGWAPRPGRPACWGSRGHTGGTPTPPGQNGPSLLFRGPPGPCLACQCVPAGARGWMIGWVEQGERVGVG
jgi:hypothetical protein